MGLFPKGLFRVRVICHQNIPPVNLVLRYIYFHPKAYSVHKDLRF